MKKPWWVVVWLLVLELCVILLFVPGDWLGRQIRAEYVLVGSSLGTESQEWISDTAAGWYRSSVIDSGLYGGLKQLVIPTEEEKSRSRGMEKMGSWWFVWLEGRIEAFVTLIYQFFTRLALLLLWAPYMLILFLPSVFDGIKTRAIKKTNFDYASPVIHRYSVRSTFILSIGLLIAFFVPLALNPVLIPLVLMGCCVLVGLTVGNLQKRV